MPRAFVSRFETSDLGPEVYSRNAPGWCESRNQDWVTLPLVRIRGSVHQGGLCAGSGAPAPGMGLSTRRPLAQSVVWPGLSSGGGCSRAGFSDMMIPPLLPNVRCFRGRWILEAPGELRLVDRVGVAADFDRSRVPRVDAGEVVDDDRHSSAAFYVAAQFLESIGLPGHDLHSLLDRPKRFADGCHYRLVPVHAIGHDPFDVESLVGRMVWSDYERAGAIVMSGVAAIEIACWDIIGKALGEPVHRLLDGAVRDHVKAYANGGYTVEPTRQDFHAAARKVI